MKQHYFELCCEAWYMRNVLGLTWKEIAYIQGIKQSDNAKYRADKLRAYDRVVVEEVGSRRVIERYKQHRELRRERYAA